MHPSSWYLGPYRQNMSLNFNITAKFYTFIAKCKFFGIRRCLSLNGGTYFVGQPSPAIAREPGKGGPWNEIMTGTVYFTSLLYPLPTFQTHPALDQEVVDCGTSYMIFSSALSRRGNCSLPRKRKCLDSSGIQVWNLVQLNHRILIRVQWTWCCISFQGGEAVPLANGEMFSDTQKKYFYHQLDKSPLRGNIFFD